MNIEAKIIFFHYIPPRNSLLVARKSHFAAVTISQWLASFFRILMLLNPVLVRLKKRDKYLLPRFRN